MGRAGAVPVVGAEGGVVGGDEVVEGEGTNLRLGCDAGGVAGQSMGAEPVLHQAVVAIPDAGLKRLKPFGQHRLVDEEVGTAREGGEGGVVGGVAGKDDVAVGAAEGE